MRAAFANEKLDIADHLHARRLGKIDRPVRLRMCQRHARRQHENGKLRPVQRAQVSSRDTLALRLRNTVRVVIKGNDIGAAGDQGLGGHEA